MSNDLILIEQLLKQKLSEVGNGITEAEFFDIFSAEQILKDYDLSYEEIENGIIDSGGDGGIDSFYFFINDTLFDEDDDLSSYKKNVRLELVFIQSKNTTGFSETAIDKFISSMRDLLDLSKPINSLVGVYCSKVLEKIDVFRKTYMALTSRFPVLTISFYYATKGIEVHPNVERKIKVLGETVNTFFSPCNFNFEFIGASQLLSLARRSPSTAHQLKLTENPISTGQVGFVCLVNIKDYFHFITDENNKLKKSIFEGNVRDYQGKTDVNEYIADSLRNPNREDFWWLNNGISIICTKATLSGKTLTVEDPEVVNGLQTSTEIYNYFVQFPNIEDQRNILVRIIVPEDESSRDRIIKATNSQTTIPPASLRATDKIHRDIEEYFQTKGFFYDRRKNYYKNQGKPIKNIISIQYLAQSVLACVLFNPSDARGRPSKPIKDDTAYRKIFNTEYPIELYYKCLLITKTVESYLKSDQCPIDKKHVNNLRFYLAMMVSLSLTGVPRPSVTQVSQIDISLINDQLLRDCLEIVFPIYEELGASDQVAKGNELEKRLLELHSKKLLERLKNK